METKTLEPRVSIPLKEYNELWQVVRWLEELNDLGVVSINDYDFTWLNNKAKLVEVKDAISDS